jgi:SNW domain-containing protein 1
MQYKENGEKDYEALARLGHHESRLVQTSFTDLLPRDLTDGQAAVILQRPSEDEIERQARETQEAFNRILAKNQSSGSINSNPKSSMVKFTPQGSTETKIVKIYEAQKDPFDPPKFSHKRAPKPPPSPPPPVLHSPPRKVSAQEQKNWIIPPCVSNWKNAKGYTIALDKRLAADGRGLRENQINEGFSTFAESLYLAESHAREEVEKRAIIEKKLAEKERVEKEETLRILASKAREEKYAIANEIIRSKHDEIANRDHDRDYERDSSDRDSKFGSIRVHGANANLSVRERENLRRQMAKEGEKEIRISRMGQEQRAKFLERMESRDISEKMALGQTVPSSTGIKSSVESVFDQRLFDQSAGIGQGLADDESYSVYDKPLFGGSAVHLIYRPNVTGDDALSEGEGEDVKAGKIRKAGKAFQGAEEGSRAGGPVEFEKDESTEVDPFGLDSFLSAAKKRHNESDSNDRNYKQRRE